MKYTWLAWSPRALAGSRAGDGHVRVFQEEDSISNVTHPAPTSSARRGGGGIIHLVHEDGADVIRIEADEADADEEELAPRLDQPVLAGGHPRGEVVSRRRTS